MQQLILLRSDLQLPLEDQMVIVANAAQQAVYEQMRPSCPGTFTGGTPSINQKIMLDPTNVIDSGYDDLINGRASFDTRLVYVKPGNLVAMYRRARMVLDWWQIARIDAKGQTYTITGKHVLACVAFGPRDPDLIQELLDTFA